MMISAAHRCIIYATFRLRNNVNLPSSMHDCCVCLTIRCKQAPNASIMMVGVGFLICYITVSSCSLNELYRGSTSPSSPPSRRWLFIYLYHRCQWLVWQSAPKIKANCRIVVAPQESWGSNRNPSSECIILPSSLTTTSCCSLPYSIQ